MRFQILLLIALIPFAIHGKIAASELTIVAEGKSEYVIAVSEQSKNPAKITEAATLLQTAIAAKRAGLPVERPRTRGLADRSQ